MYGRVIGVALRKFSADYGPSQTKNIATCINKNEKWSKVNSVLVYDLIKQKLQTYKHAFLTVHDVHRGVVRFEQKGGVHKGKAKNV